MNQLKQKILKINSYSILILIFLFSIITFISVYILLNKFYHKEIDVVKDEYLSSQKLIIKNEVNNFIDFIKHTRKTVKKERISMLEKNVKTIAQVLSIVKPTEFREFLDIIKNRNPEFKFGLTYLNGDLVFTTAKDYTRKSRLNSLKEGLNKLHIKQTKVGIKYFYLRKFKNKIDNKIYVIGSAIYEKNIDALSKKIIIDRIYGIKFGAKNNGYLSIAKILNYKGGETFAKVIALPVKPGWVGKILNDSKKDAKGKLYRKEYLKIANTSKEGFVSYWFFKKKTKSMRPKLSYVKLYKPFDWLIFTSVYIDDVNSVINQKEKIIKKEIKEIFIVYTIFSFLFLIIAYLITKYENLILQRIMDSYENIIKEKNEELKEINQNLEKEVQEKTTKLIDSLLRDNLTKLPNREKLILDLKQEKKYLAILNIDSFKEINDFYGVEVGDIVLKKIGNMLKNTINKDVYKLPADEFAISYKDLNILEESLKELIYIFNLTSLKIDKELSINISFSIGIGETLTKADMALKYAKKSKMKVVVFNEKLNIQKEYENNLKWRKIIHNAIQTDNIIPFIQPIINNKTQKIEKYECLVRLKDDKIYSPFFFLEISKHTNQYYEIQKIMVEKCFQKFSKLNYKFSINLATWDLKNFAFKEFLIAKIEEYNVYNKLIVELLEDEELLQDEVILFIKELKEKGIEIAIDDFGSGYSNISYLVKDIPLDILKIDGSLIKNIANSEKDFKLLKAILNMAGEFEFKIVAEFVENKDIVEILQNTNIDYLQGYYFSAPFDISKLEN